MTLIQGLLLFVAALLAGMINSVAGGGTLLTFPTLAWVGHAEKIANATSTVALVPGAWSSMLGYRSEVQQTPRRFLVLLIPSLTGGVIGAMLLERTPAALFSAIVPFLVLFATLLFMVQEPIRRWLGAGDGEQRSLTNRWLAGAVCYQFLVGVYGGYFGAGIGILMLSALSLLGMSDIHQMNGVKNFFASIINSVAAGYFILFNLVDWPAALLMAVGSIIGGYGAAGLARKLGRTFVKRTVIVIGLGMAISLFIKQSF
ncbi:MAG TPA: sulfite exporter TauE/SafE family protein [Blastocatellia bacterium]|nr:sulfite exporter TauE/SafE family protein [Blastocatellia bacterium]